MKVFTVLLLAGYASCHGSHGSGFSGMDQYKMYKMWTEMKAFEGCWGEENTRTHQVEMKQAVARCKQQGAPELSLPPYRSTYRFINTLLTSADNMEKAQANFVLQKLMSYSSQQPSHNQYHRHNTYDNMNNNDNFLQKMINTFSQQNPVPLSMGNNNKMYNTFRDSEDKDLEQKIRESMMEFKMMQLNQGSTRSLLNNPFSPENNYREKIQALLTRHRRQAEVATLPDTLDIGDRLAEKMKQQKERMTSEVGNMTCILREVGVLNEDNELDINTQKKMMEKYSFSDDWFKNRINNDLETCNKVAQALPAEVQNEFVFPGLANVPKVQSFMKCIKYAKAKSCMYKDIKAKVETNFGPLAQILEQSNLTEDQLFPLVISLYHGEDEDFAGF